MNAPAQGSIEWLAQRSGHCTASRFKDVLARIKSGEAASRRSYRMQLVTERLTGTPCESYKNAAMEWGTATQLPACMAYEALTGALVDEAPFMLHPSIKWCGASPDGLVDEDGAIEIKCPYQSTVHVETFDRGMPSEHMAQCQGVLWVTGRKWIDFISYDPRMPEHLKVYRQRIERDERYIENLSAEVCNFVADIDALYMRLMSRSTLLDQLVASVNMDTVAMQP